jgi:pimeloyl-ACP methyl ester carboxylesterase
VSEPRPYEVRVSGDTVADLRQRLGRTRWPQQPGDGWPLGTDLADARELCEHWAERYDFGRLERLNELGSASCEGVHFLRGGEGEGEPIVLLHGWPSGPIEYEPALRLLRDSGREVIVPSLPGYAWSEDPGVALTVAGMAERLEALLEEGLGINRYALAGGDWGCIIAARMSFDRPESVSGLYVSTPGTLPTPPDLADPPPSEEELAYAERARRWLRREGHHMAIQSAAPDAISPALTDSPAGLAAYLLEKYRRWSDSGGEVGRRFSKDLLCDFLTMFWASGSIASSMRLYWAERRDRWRLQPGERIVVPSAIGVFPGDSEGGTDSNTLATLNPPREWSERVLSDLRRWKVHRSGGHFAALEEPEAYVDDLEGFLDAL